MHGKLRYLLTLLVGYALWLTLGTMGAHQFYFGRRQHGLLWMCTCGGFVMGWLLDFAKIPSYVSQSFEEFKRPRGAPGCSMQRWAGQLFTGMWFGFLANWSVPRYIWDQLFENEETRFGANTSNDMALILVPIYVSFAISCGIYIVGCVGSQIRTFKSTFLGVLLTHMVMFTISRQYGALFWTAFFGAMASNRSARFKTSKHEGMSRIKLFACLCAYFGFIGLIAWHLPVPTVEKNGFAYMSGQKLGPSIVEAIRSIEMEDVRAAYKFVLNNRWSGVKAKLKEKLRKFAQLLSEFQSIPDIHSKARKILGMDLSKASKSEVHSKCRQLLRKYHPDLQRSQSETSQEKSYALYLQIQDVCDAIKRSWKFKL